MFYRLFRLLASLTLRVFFRRIEVQGRSTVPSGPVLLVANHTNALVDPLLPLITLSRRVTLTGKNVLKKNPLLAVITWGLGSIPFHRAEDVGKGASPRENVRSVQRCREILAAGGAVCMFPEGISHSDLKMRAFHTGSAKIALDYVKKNANSPPLTIVPIGLLYTAKDRFRSDVYLRFGPGFAPTRTADQLTDQIRRAIEDLTIAYEDRREMLIVNWAGEIVATQAQIPTMLGSPQPPVAESFARLNRLQSGYRALRQTHGPQIESLSADVRRYRGELKRHGISPAEVYLPITPARATLFLLRELELIFVGGPIALFGALNHLLPYLLVRTIARRLSVDKDHWASNVVYPSFVVFPLFYAAQIAAAWIFLPAFWAAVYTIALPYTGYYAVLYGERAGSAWRRACTFIYFLFKPAIQRRLADQGRQILAGIYALQQEGRIA
jgi:glycerol-3-phosphate O-acyltransferase / dihydroxyacetone phosphate acyltransferase